MKATAKSVLRKISSRIQGTTVSSDAPVMIAMPQGTDLITALRSMIDKGQGGARGLAAATRLDALRGLDILCATDADRAIEVAHVITRGERSQGLAVADLIMVGRA